jgi:hypothetical protein
MRRIIFLKVVMMAWFRLLGFVYFAAAGLSAWAAPTQKLDFNCKDGSFGGYELTFSGSASGAATSLKVTGARAIFSTMTEAMAAAESYLKDKAFSPVPGQTADDTMDELRALNPEMGYYSPARFEALKAQALPGAPATAVDSSCAYVLVRREDRAPAYFFSYISPRDGRARGVTIRGPLHCW